MNTRTPLTDAERYPPLRVLEGGRSPRARQEDEPAALLDSAWLADEMAAAARLCDALEGCGQRITFCADPSGGAIRAQVIDEEGRLASELALAEVVSPAALVLTMGGGR